MSVKLSHMVWEAEFPSLAMKLVALKLADYANDEGENIYPAVGTIETRTGASQSTVREVLADMEASGLLVVIEEGCGNRFGRSTTIRRMDVARLKALGDKALVWARVAVPVHDRDGTPKTDAEGQVRMRPAWRLTPPVAGGVEAATPPLTGGVPLRSPDPHPSGERTLTVKENRKSLPLAPASGGTGGGKDGDEAGIISERQSTWLATLRSEPHDAQVIARLIAPLLTERRFSAAAPLEELRALIHLAKGLPGPALAKAWELIRAASHNGRPLTTIKPARVRDAIAAVRKGGALYPLRKGTPQWHCWREHLAATGDRKTAAMIEKFDGWLVRSEWPPGAAPPLTSANPHPGAAA